MTNDNQIYYGKLFTMYTSIKALCCAPETNMPIISQFKKMYARYQHLKPTWLLIKTHYNLSSFANWIILVLCFYYKAYGQLIFAGPALSQGAMTFNGINQNIFYIQNIERINLRIVIPTPRYTNKLESKSYIGLCFYCGLVYLTVLGSGISPA